MIGPGSRPAETFQFEHAALEPARTLCVDGVVSGLRCLSHWPGHGTPPALSHDLSTGILLAYAGLDVAAQEALVGPWDVVTNNHYDTDGVLSVFAALRPDAALPRATRLLATAATGDFGVWQGPEALALDLTIMALPGHANSPTAGSLAGVTSDAERWEFCTRWLVDRLADLADRPFEFQHLWADRHALITAEVAAADAGSGPSVETHPDLDLALVTADEPLTRIGLHRSAGSHDRVLLVRPTGSGWRYRFLYRAESWFDLVRKNRPPPRRPLDEARRTLQRSERGAGRWWTSSLQAPVAALGFGNPTDGEQPLFNDPDIETAAASSHPPEAVLDALRGVLSE